MKVRGLKWKTLKGKGSVLHFCQKKCTSPKKRLKKTVTEQLRVFEFKKIKNKIK